MYSFTAPDLQWKFAENICCCLVILGRIRTVTERELRLLGEVFHSAMMELFLLFCECWYKRSESRACKLQQSQWLQGEGRAESQQLRNPQWSHCSDATRLASSNSMLKIELFHFRSTQMTGIPSWRSSLPLLKVTLLTDLFYYCKCLWK